jgi:hypothetical protein
MLCAHVRLRRLSAAPGICAIAVFTFAVAYSAAARAGGAPFSTTHSSQYLIIARDRINGNTDVTGNEFELGAHRAPVPSTSSFLDGGSSGGPTLLGTVPNIPLNAAPFVIGISGDGNIAVTDPNGFFNFQNIGIYAPAPPGGGIRIAGTLGSLNNSGNSFFNDPNQYPNTFTFTGFTNPGVNNNTGGFGNSVGVGAADPSTLIDAPNHEGVTFAFNHSALLSELVASAKATISGLTTTGVLGTGGDGVLNANLTYTLSPGLNVIDIHTTGSGGGNSFVLNNMNLVIDGPAGASAIFRLLGGDNMQISNSNILLGNGGIGYENILFVTRQTENDTHFDFNNTIINGVAFWSLGPNGGSININNSQGCTQLIADIIDLDDVRFTRCAFAATGCTSDEECDDDDLCTVDDCVGGSCENTPVACNDDGTFCNGNEICDPATGMCISTGNPCSGPTPVCCEAADVCEEECCFDADCDDSELCTTDACVNGVCQNAPVECMDDGLFCNGDEICDPMTGMCISTGNPCGGMTPICCEAADVCEEECCFDADCDDFNACTTDACVSGVCQNTPVICTDDGSYCNGPEACNPATGLCESGPTPCAMGLICCEDTDSCVKECCADADCPNDMQFCTGQNLCVNGSCKSSGGPCAMNEVCCEAGQTCEPECCDDFDCPDDGLFCTGSEVCTGGVCGSTGDPCGGLTPVCCEAADACEEECCFDTDCEDFDNCTTDACVFGICQNDPVICNDDGSFCNGMEFCDPNTGMCVFAGNPCSAPTPLCCEATDTCEEECCLNSDCNDSDKCTTDACVGGVCQHTPVTCESNGVYCDGVEACDPNTSMCVSSGNPCSSPTGVCCEASDTCVAECCGDPDCDDGQACTIDSCDGGACDSVCEQPGITCPTDKTFECDAVGDFGDPVVDDDCSITPEVECVEEVTPGKLPQERSILRTCTITNDCDNSASCHHTIDVVDTTPPEVTCPPDLSFECGAVGPFGDPIVSDNCDDDPDVVIEVETVINDCTPPNTAGVLIPPKFNTTRTVTVTDGTLTSNVATGGGGNITQCVQHIQIFDTTPPTIPVCPSAVAACLNEPFSFTPPACIDSCGPCNVACVRSDGQPLNAPVTGPGVFITCTATDECLNPSGACVIPVNATTCRIPAMSTWGFVILTLLLVVGGKAYFGYRKSAVA